MDIAQSVAAARWQLHYEQHSYKPFQNLCKHVLSWVQMYSFGVSVNDHRKIETIEDSLNMNAQLEQLDPRNYFLVSWRIMPLKFLLQSNV